MTWNFDLLQYSVTVTPLSSKCLGHISIINLMLSKAIKSIEILITSYSQKY